MFIVDENALSDIGYMIMLETLFLKNNNFLWLIGILRNEFNCVWDYI